MPFLEPPQSEYLAKYPRRPYWVNLLLWNWRNFGGWFSEMLRTDAMPRVSDWNPDFGWVFLTHKSGLPFVSFRARAQAYKVLPNGAKVMLPLIAYQSISHGDQTARIKRFFPWIEFYIGWRPNGAPGIALRLTCSRGY